MSEVEINHFYWFISTSDASKLSPYHGRRLARPFCKTRRAAARRIAQIHFGLGVNGNAHGILATIRHSVDYAEVVKTCPELDRRDGVRFLDFFQRLSLLRSMQVITQTIQNVA